MSEQYCDTLILSDVHLGSELSRAGDALQVLQSNRFGRLVLLGDIFSDLNFGRLKKEHWQFLSHIRKLSNPKRQVEVVWVEGNHDQGLSTLMSHLVGVRVYQEYAWDFQGQRHLAIHGHQFDRFVVNNALVSKLGSWAYLEMQKLDLGRKRLTRFLDRLNTRWLRLSRKVADGALLYARQHGASRVFCGHTHAAMRCQRDGVEYYNTGCWVSNQPSYITINQEGVSLHEYAEPTDHRDPSQERGETDWALDGLADEAGLPADAVYEGAGR